MFYILCQLKFKTLLVSLDSISSTCKTSMFMKVISSQAQNKFQQILDISDLFRYFI